MLGNFLRLKRKEAKLSLKNIADQTYIGLNYLDAIENGNYNKIYAEVFLKSYIKDYARSLFLNPEEILNMYEEEKKQLQLNC